jgi:hypothetical protein
MRAIFSALQASKDVLEREGGGGGRKKCSGTMAGLGLGESRISFNKSAEVIFLLP